MATEEQVRLAARVYEMRDCARRFLGERYMSHMAETRKMLETAQSRLKIDDPLTAATKICVANSLGGLDVIYIMAAAVEMIEPSPSPTPPEQP